MLIAGGLFGADFVLMELPRQQALQAGDNNVPAVPAGSSGSVASTGVSVSSSSSSKRVVKKGTSTKKKAGIDVGAVFSQLQLITQQTDETGFLTFVMRDPSSVKTWVLLRNNDRAYLFSWVDSPDAKPIFGSLKQALSEQFSGKLTDLIDETRTPEGGPPVDILSFFDPTLSPEKIVFLRVRTRLYEIHAAKNGEETLDALVTNLSK